MNKKSSDFEIVPLPKTRRGISEMLHEGQRKHMVHGLTEIDVTKPRQIIREHKTRTGERLSFTAFITNCLAQAVDENKMMQGYRKGKNRVVLFADVDVNTQIERDVNGRKWVMPYIIRAANRKSFYDIHQEIRAAQVKPLDNAREFKQYDYYLRLPRFLRHLFMRLFMKMPRLTKEIAGTVGVTAVGMFGRGGGWGLPITTQTLLLTLGGIAEKPGVVAGQIAIREYLSVTVSFDHDIIDGAPAARFTQRLTELVETGYGLEQTNGN